MSDIDWEIRPAETADHGAIRTLLGSAFDTAAEADLVEALRSDDDAEIELVAENTDNGEIVGHVLLSRMQSPEKTLALAPVATGEAYRCQGIAASLIESALATAMVGDYLAVFVLGDLSYYARFGFDVDRAKAFPSPYAGEHFAIAIFESDNPPATTDARHARAFAALG